MNVLKESLKESGPTTQSGNQAIEKATVFSINVCLNPCDIDFDPGLVDRTFMLLNYADLDPGCICYTAL